MVVDPLEELLLQEVVNEERLLGLVDEYQLLSHYLGFAPELRTPYLSPIRGEGKGSFSLFSSTRSPGVCEFLWKDSGNGQSGNVFKLVQLLYSLSSKQEVFKQIDRDFHLDLFPGNDYGETPIPCQCTTKPIPKAPAQIRIKSREFTREALQYWEGYGIGVDLLTQYRVSQVSHFWTQPHQLEPYTSKGMMFSYGIGNKYKLYQPHNPDLKFLNNLDPYMMEGWLQLPIGKLDLLILTKSMKDCLTLRSLGYWGIAGRSESTPIPQTQLDLIQGKARRVVTLFDQDTKGPENWGQLHVQKYAHMGWDNIAIPIPLAQQGSKDISDNYKLRGREHSLDLLHHLLYPCQ